jgi:excisionase family DNA binding protein
MPKKSPPETPLYVRLPATASDKLDRASETLGVPKKDLVAGLVSRYVDPDSQQAMTALGAMSSGPRRPGDGVEGSAAPLTMGTYTYQPYHPFDAPEVLTAEQAAMLLQVDAALVNLMAEEGKLPGRRLGKVWRFSRAALIAWISTPEVPR